MRLYDQLQQKVIQAEAEEAEEARVQQRRQCEADQQALIDMAQRLAHSYEFTHSMPIDEPDGLSITLLIDREIELTKKQGINYIKARLLPAVCSHGCSTYLGQDAEYDLMTLIRRHLSFKYYGPKA